MPATKAGSLVLLIWGWSGSGELAGNPVLQCEDSEMRCFLGAAMLGLSGPASRAQEALGPHLAVFELGNNLVTKIELESFACKECALTAVLSFGSRFYLLFEEDKVFII